MSNIAHAGVQIAKFIHHFNRSIALLQRQYEAIKKFERVYHENVTNFKYFTDLLVCKDPIHEVTVAGIESLFKREHSYPNDRTMAYWPNIFRYYVGIARLDIGDEAVDYALTCSKWSNKKALEIIERGIKAGIITSDKIDPSNGFTMHIDEWLANAVEKKYWWNMYGDEDNVDWRVIS